MRRGQHPPLGNDGPSTVVPEGRLQGNLERCRALLGVLPTYNPPGPIVLVVQTAILHGCRPDSSSKKNHQPENGTNYRWPHAAVLLHHDGCCVVTLVQNLCCHFRTLTATDFRRWMRVALIIWQWKVLLLREPSATLIKFPHKLWETPSWPTIMEQGNSTIDKGFKLSLQLVSPARQTVCCLDSKRELIDFFF